MREWWANVYEGGAHYENMGRDYERREDAAEYDREPVPYRPLYRIHVRLKPEGAPRRYANEGERRVWQHDPDWARGVTRTHSHEVAERMIESRAGQLQRI